MSSSSCNILESLDCTEFLVFGSTNAIQSCETVISGSLDALIVYATKLRDSEYTEAFINTYRTLLTPILLFEKLIYRFKSFILLTNDEYQHAAIATFRFFELIYYDLMTTEKTQELYDYLKFFFAYAITNNTGFRKSAELMRNNFESKLSNIKNDDSPKNGKYKHLNIMVKADSKSRKIAKRIANLDYYLFHEVKTPELLYVNYEDNKSPNLLKALDYFDKLHRWTVNQILGLEKETKHLLIFAKLTEIMHYLKKKRYYNSYYAILTALSSDKIKSISSDSTSSGPASSAFTEEYAKMTKKIKEEMKEWDSSDAIDRIKAELDNQSSGHIKGCVPHIESFIHLIDRVDFELQATIAPDDFNFEKQWRINTILMYWRIITQPEPPKNFYPFAKIKV